jgi:hypothetical protein
VILLNCTLSSHEGPRPQATEFAFRVVAGNRAGTPRNLTYATPYTIFSIGMPGADTGTAATSTVSEWSASTTGMVISIDRRHTLNNYNNPNTVCDCDDRFDARLNG